MIYEKRFPDKTKALPASDVLKTPRISVYKAENIIPYVTPKVPKKNIRRRFKMQRKNSQKGYFLPKAICVFLTIAFVLMTADKYLFCGLLKQTAFFSAKTAINGLIEQNSDKNTAKNKKIWENQGKNSLYSNALFSVNSVT